MESLVNNNLYQVFVVQCSCNFPCNFAHHHWLVINKKGKLARYEVLIYKERNQTSWGHLHLNCFEPFQGLDNFPVDDRTNKKAELVSYVEGDEDSIVLKIIAFIENSKNTYPYRYRYFLPGPNSNTYVQWVLDHFPEANLKLSRRGFGKGYKIEE